MSFPTYRVLINSLPKSGTHLLAKAIEILGYQEHFDHENHDSSPIPWFLNYREVRKKLSDEEKLTSTEYSNEKISIGALTPCYVNVATLRNWLDTIPEKKYILGHIPWTPVLSSVLSEIKYHHLFIIRDPRAVVASSIPFILDTGKMPSSHFLEDDLQIMSSIERLKFVLEGGYAPKAGLKINNFAAVYRSMLAWKNEPNCLFTNFEDLVGEQGGGTFEKQINVVKKIADYLKIPFDENIYSQLTEIYSPAARTFRTGKIDKWKDSLDAESIEYLVEYCKPLCQEAGYDI